MKNIQLLLLMILTQITFVQVAQESKSGYDSDSDTVQSFKRRRLDSPVDEQPVVAATIAEPTVADVVAVDQERHNLIKSMTQNFYVLDKGFDLLLKQGKKIEPLDRFIDQNLEIDTNDQNAQINKNRVGFGAVVQRVEDIIMHQMKEPFLQSFTNVIFSSEQKNIYAKISQRRDPVLHYVMDYKDTQLKPIIREWINNQDDFGKTLLFKVIASADDIYDISNIVDLLLSLGANPNIQDKNGQTLLHQAPDSLPIEVLEVLLTPREDNVPVNLNIQDNEGMTAIFETYTGGQRSKGKINLFNSLYQVGADPTIFDDEGCFSSSLEKKIEEYCHKHADMLHAQYLENWKLRQAIIDQSIPLIKNLIEQGADIDFLPEQQKMIEIYLNIKQNNDDFYDDQSNLALACQLNVDIEIIKILLESGARPNKVNNSYDLPALHKAVGNFNVEAVKLLIEYGANVNQLQYSNLFETPLFAAVRIGPNDEYKDTDIRKEIIKLLLDNGAVKSLTETDFNYMTPLMYVVQNNRIDLVKLLLEYKFNINYIDPYGCYNRHNIGNTPLHIASENNYIDIARLLLAYKGIDTSTRNTAGQTALDVAATDEMRALLQ